MLGLLELYKILMELSEERDFRLVCSSVYVSGV